jgi:hypothetical protein
MQTLARGSSLGERRLISDVGIALGVGLLGALAKKYLDFHLGIPGHAGVGWIAVLVAGRLGNPRAGMATLSGLAMGVWGVPVGLGHSLGYNTLLYGMAGALLDSAPLMRLPLTRSWGAALAGAAVHVAKYGFIFANAWLSDMLRRVEVYGFLRALGNHVVFGAAGGLVGWAAWRSGRSLWERLGRRGEGRREPW